MALDLVNDHCSLHQFANFFFAFKIYWKLFSSNVQSSAEPVYLSAAVFFPIKFNDKTNEEITFHFDDNEAKLFLF